MDEHQRLVNSLIEALQRRGYAISHAVGGSYVNPYVVGRHEPDIIARDQNGLIIIGEAKTPEDITNERSREQYLDFSNRIMSDGLLKGRQVPLHIIVPRDSSILLRQTLNNLGLSNKVGDVIFIWIE